MFMMDDLVESAILYLCLHRPEEEEDRRKTRRKKRKKTTMMIFIPQFGIKFAILNGYHLENHF